MTLELIKDGQIKYESTLILGQILIVIGSGMITWSNIMLGKQTIPEVVKMPGNYAPRAESISTTTNTNYFDS